MLRETMTKTELVNFMNEMVSSEKYSRIICWEKMKFQMMEFGWFSFARDTRGWE